MIKSITFPQVALCAVMLGFTFAAYKFLGPEAAGAMMTATTMVALMLGRKSDEAP